MGWRGVSESVRRSVGWDTPVKLDGILLRPWLKSKLCVQRSRWMEKAMGWVRNSSHMKGPTPPSFWNYYETS